MASSNRGGDVDVSGECPPPEFGQTPSVRMVEVCERYVFLCYKGPHAWPPQIESSEFDRLPRILASTLSQRKRDMKREIVLKLCEGHDGAETSNGDVFIFPDMIRYRSLTHFDVDTFIEEVLVKDREWLPGRPEALMGWYIFVCCHSSRDMRCGICGQAIISKFIKEIELRGLQGMVSVSPCSHIGNHKYAGNVIIFGPNTKKDITGQWFGDVLPEDVPQLLDQNIGKGEIVASLRQHIKLSKEDEQISQGEGSVSASTFQVESTGSCQGVDGRKKREMTGCPDSTQAEKKRSKRISAQKMHAVPTWYTNWEREDTYAALAVVGAVLSVMFAFRCYRQTS